MTSTFSPSLRLELMATGDQSGSWGTTTNTNLGTLIEQAIAGFLSKAQGDVANLTLTATDGASDEARNMVIDITGALTAGRNVVVPTAEKLYLFKNSTTGGFAITVKTSGGTGVAIAAGTAQWVYCDGTNVVQGLSGTMAAQAASAVAITGGTIAGLTTLTMTSGAATPATNDAAALGTSTLMWSDLFLASGAVVNFNNGDVTIAHSANTLAFAGASSGYTYDAAVLPSANDAAALGASGTAWADLFLASGGVINFNAGNATITHSAGLLTFNTAISLGTSLSATVGTIELGHASDTTLSRSAAGVLAVEGNLVPSPGSQATGDILYRGASSWSRLGIGTALQVLRTNAGATAPEWTTLATGGMTLLDTLTTTSGTTATSSTIAAGYKQLYIELDDVSFSSNTTMTLALSSTNGAAYGTAQNISVGTGGSSGALKGYITVSNISSTVASAKAAISVTATAAGAGTVTGAILATNTAAVVNKIQFGGGTFDAGTIRIYGVS